MNIADCITYLRPDAEFSMIGNNYDTLEWRSSDAPPTIKDIEDCWPVVRDRNFMATMRKHRDALLAASDWTQMPDNGLTDEQRAAWAQYRQALRDAPASWTVGPTWDAPDPPA